MHQNRFRLGLCPRPHWGSLQLSPDHLAGFKGPTSKGGEGGEERLGMGWEVGRGEGGEEGGRGRKGGRGWSPPPL